MASIHMFVLLFSIALVLSNAYQFQSSVNVFKNLNVFNKLNINTVKTSFELNVAKGKNYGPSARLVKGGVKSNVQDQDLKSQLSSAGKSGLVAYGLLNLLYYTTAAAASWKILVSDVSLKGTISLSKKLQIVTVSLMKLSGIVWAGSQVTKALRLVGAIALAPTADKLLNSFQNKFKLASKDQAFWIVTSLILTSFFLFYGSLIVFTALFGFK